MIEVVVVLVTILTLIFVIIDYYISEKHGRRVK